jgi:hypothetical protein
MWLRAAAALGLAGALALAGCSRSNPQEREVTDQGAQPRQPLSGVAPLRQEPTVPAASPRELLPPDRTHAVISGVLSWDDPGLAGFSTRARKDLELAKLLEQRGVPEGRIKVLLDAEATTGAIIDAVAVAARQAPAGATLLFYYAGHGVRGADGNAYFASRDMRSGAPEETGLSLDRLTHTITEHFHGQRVVLMADCCYSGALKAVAERLSASGLAAVSLTSADAANVSTKNWTFTQAIIDGLRGDALCDEDGNGTIVLEELSTEVRAAMLFREGQRYGYHRASVAPDVVVGTTVSLDGRPERLPANRRRYVEIETPRGWQVARVRAAAGDQLTVRTYDYSLSTDHQVAVAQTRPIEFRHYAAGAAVEVYWGGKVWPAKVERADGDFHFISYPGWPAYWNEWVTSRRIVDATSKAGVIPQAAAVMVEWRGDWYPAQVLQRKADRYLIHYDGYDASWDEWVGQRRIRRR